MQNKIDFHRKRDFSNKLNATVEFIKRNFKPLFKSILYIAGPFVLIGSLLMSSFYNVMFFGNPDFVEPDLALLGLKGVGISIFLLLATVAIITVVYNYMVLYEKNQGESISVNEVFTTVKSSFWSVLGTVFLYILVFVVGYLILLIPTSLIAVTGSGIGTIMIFIMMLLIAYFVIATSLVFFIRIYEKVGFVTAISRSIKLTKGKWWSTFGLLFVIGLIQGVLSSIFIIPYYINTFMSAMHSVESGAFPEPSGTTMLINQLSLLFYFIVAYTSYALPLVALAFQYFNLTEMKEAKGLIDKIESFDQLAANDKDEEHY